MKALTVYQCEYCKKLFRTSDRHNCKRDPEHKNCFSCKYHDQFREGKDWVNEGYGGFEVKSLYPQCDKYDLESIEDFNGIVDYMYHDSWNLACESWEQREPGWKPPSEVDFAWED